MTEPDLPYVKPAPEIPPETNELIPPSPDVKNKLPNHEPIEKEATADFICPVCGKPFDTKADLDLHMLKDHGQLKKA
jgi:hypothetical protein